MTPRKIMLLGEIGVGKSSIARRLVFDSFDTDYKPTLGVDVYTYEIEPAPGEKGMRFIIWDTDGNFGDSIMSLIYIKQAAAAFVVGDLTRRATLEAMVHTGNSFLEAMPGRYCGFLLNKSDMPDAAIALPPELEQSPIPAIRTSAKSGENVREAFVSAAEAIHRRGY